VTTCEELRDLADKIDKVAREHSSFSVVHEITNNCVSHIRAVARVHELNVLEARSGYSFRCPTK
jgi:hypothetical protein